jgi:hypothetical protein
MHLPINGAGMPFHKQRPHDQLPRRIQFPRFEKGKMMSGLSTIAGMPIYFTDMALEKTSERLFPESKNRSKRIHKKLVKRFGGEIRMRPAMFQINGVLYCHPANRPALERIIADSKMTKER